ncbi:stemmadenine O-acetyltransferase-like [Mercurialis annua]|uniref:stemmadenine O-acetyltransferase-like n=1 Tax=Mercurialis annua TaxID=3986 RepID=UPI00215F0DE8|nr:stemmadenine O-acetyltransferase-like [Mercurialis annua]
MEVERVSEECIKPSSSTPSHPKTYTISLLDQFIPSMYFPIILFYHNQNPNLTDIKTVISERSKLLKKSLSETLTRFYPLAGKHKDNLSVDCNDEGVYYVEARANISLSKYQNEFIASTATLLPQKFSYYEELAPGSYVAMIQETNFACGGISIGILASHKIMDGTAACFFIKHWAKVATKSYEGLVCPNFNSSFIFPKNDEFPKEASLVEMMSPTLVQQKKMTTKRIGFNASAVASLKAKAMRLGVENPTSVEVVSALFTEHLMAISKVRSGTEKAHAVTHAVNLRRKASPPFSEDSVGNFIWTAATLCKPKEATFSTILLQIRESIASVDSDFVEKLQGDKGLVKLYERVKEMRTSVIAPPGLSCEVDQIKFVSWCKLGLYEIDFGWGKPSWATNCFDTFDGSEIMFGGSAFYLMDTKEEKGIEVWAFLDEKDMLLLEKDNHFLQFASIHPLP